MSYAMGIDCCKSGNVCCNCLAEPNNLRDDDYTHSHYRNPVACLEFFIQQPEFREHMSYAAAKEFNHADECIYSWVKSSDWWWNEQVCELNFVIATMIWTASMTTPDGGNYHCALLRQFRINSSSTIFTRYEGITGIC